MKLVRKIVLAALRHAPLRAARHRRFMRTPAPSPAALAGGSPLQVLVLGVYLGDRAHSAVHLQKRLGSTDRLRVEQRWMAIHGVSGDPALAAVSQAAPLGPEAKFVLVNRLLRPGDPDRYDFVIVCDDDIHLQAGFLESFLALQTELDWSIAQPARTWHSHFDHLFALRRPWWRARQTRFVECGPLVSFRRDAARLLLPFEGAEQMWGLDFVWPRIMRDAGLKMGIVDAVAVDHSLRPQASTYDKVQYDAAMHRFLSTTPHLTMGEAFTVVARHPR